MALRKPQITESKASATKEEEVKIAQEAKAARAAEVIVDPAPEVDPAPDDELESDDGVELEAEATDPKPEVETKAPLEEKAEAKTEVATTSEQGQGVAVKRASMAANFTANLAAQGFEDLQLTGFSFDRIKLHEGKFLLGSEEFDLGEEFECIIHSTRAIYVVRQSSEEDAEVYYSYDPKGATLTDGTPADAVLAEWQEDGYATEEQPVDVKKYMEVMVTLVNRDDEYDDSMASLSIPPASVDRLAGAAAQALQKFKSAPDGVITRCKVGKKAGEGKKAFRPWVFQVVSKIG